MMTKIMMLMLIEMKDQGLGWKGNAVDDYDYDDKHYDADIYL